MIISIRRRTIHDWAAYAAGRGWSLLSKDDAIRVNALALNAIFEAKIAVFLFGHGSINASQMVEAVVAARPTMYWLIDNEPRSFIARIGKLGAVKMLYRADRCRIIPPQLVVIGK